MIRKVCGGEDGNTLEDFTYTEFLGATLDRRHCLQPSVLKAAFSSFDRNGDGNISMAELAGGKLLGHLTMDEISHIFDELDSNGDCYIDPDEYATMMMTGMINNTPADAQMERDVMSPPTSPKLKSSRSKT